MMRCARELSVGPFRIRDMHYERGITHARHVHSEVQISVIVRGEIREDADAQTYRGRAGDVILKPAGTVHADEFEETRIVCIDFRPQSIETVTGGYAWHRFDGVAASGFRLAHRFLAGADVCDDVHELVGSLPTARLRDRVAATRAARMIDDAPASPLGINTIAAELRLHPVYLTRIFTERWGCTPREYLQRVRVRAATHGIASTNRPLADIASETGFSDQAHMTRTVARVTGLTPGALRRAART